MHSIISDLLVWKTTQMRRVCNCCRKSNYERERDSESQEENTITNSNPDFEPHGTNSHYKYA
jgi:hypothetical protein